MKNRVDQLVLESEVRALTEHLAPELALEIHRLLHVAAHVDELRDRVRELEVQLNRAQTVAGECRGLNATLQNRLASYGPEEVLKARRDAYMLGAGFLRVLSVGANQYVTEHVPAKQVVIHED